MSKLTVHVLDMATGQSAEKMRISLETPSGKTYLDYLTGIDGRTPQPLLEGDALSPGLYRMTFFLSEYYKAKGIGEHEDAFMDKIFLEFRVNEGENYHLPLVITPWSYSVYRGS